MEAMSECAIDHRRGTMPRALPWRRWRAEDRSRKRAAGRDVGADEAAEVGAHPPPPAFLLLQRDGVLRVLAVVGRYDVGLVLVEKLGVEVGRAEVGDDVVEARALTDPPLPRDLSVAKAHHVRADDARRSDAFAAGRVLIVDA